MKDKSKRRRGLMLILSSPSGAGKTAISREILKNDKDISLSVSATTRKPRDGEENGVDYFFVDEEAFTKMVKNNELLEHAKVFDNYYGTPAKPVFESLEKGKDVLFDVDWQGKQLLAENESADIVSIFILPPSMEELEKRLFGRGKDTQEVVKLRMSKAADEISHWNEYDYVIVNKNLEKSIRRVKSILIAERLKRKRQIGLAKFVNIMRASKVTNQTSSTLHETE